MKKLLNSTLLIILVLVVINVSAQPDPRVSQPNNVVIKRIANKVEKTGWITYKRGIKLTGHEIFGELKDAFGLSSDDSMQEKASQNDESQNRHLKFQQFYKGIPIEDSEYFLHYNQRWRINRLSWKNCRRYQT